jgi:ABC-2 type transport system permease protein
VSEYVLGAIRVAPLRISAYPSSPESSAFRTMINFAIFIKTVRDSLATLAFAAVATCGFVILFVWAMVNMGQELLTFVSQFPFLRNIFEMSLGIRVEGEVSINILLAVCFTHLVVLILAWGTIIAITTRVSVGEVERGTADLLLSLPVSRFAVALSTSLVWVLAAAILASCALIGVWIGGRLFAGDEPIRFSSFVPAAVNLFALHLAIGGLSQLLSGIANRRGVAIGIVLGIALVSMTLNFVEPFIPPLQRLRSLGLLHYFRPVDVIRTAQWPTQNCLTLIGFGLICWSIGTAVFCRKDIPAA